MTNFTQDLKNPRMEIKTEKVMSTTEPEASTLSENETKITILAPSFTEAAIMFHKQNLSAKGYRLTSRIEAHKFFESEGSKLSPLFDGKALYAVTFEYDAKLSSKTSTN